MDNAKDIVITGLGIVSSIGSGLDTYWDALLAGQSGAGISSHYTLDDVRQIARLPYPMVAEVKELETKRIKPRKNIKVMARDIQLGFVAADYAREHCQLEAKPVDPDRQGIVYGAMMIIVDVSELGELYMGAVDENGVYHPSQFGNAMGSMYPLWMLKYLPNMTACHIGIAFDLRGPSNTVVCGETGGVSAILEACRVLRRGYTDLMFAGGCACCTTPSAWTRYDFCQLSSQFDHPQTAFRPFDAKRDGVVFGEGAGCSVIETRESAQRRGVPIYAKILGCAETAEHVWNAATDFTPQPEEVKIDRKKFTGDSLRNAVRLAVERSGLKPEDFAFVMASGNATIQGDAAEARAIREVLGDVPVTAISGATGYAMSGTSAIAIATTALALDKGVIPAVVNCDEVAADCPINVVTGSPREIPADKKAALVLSYNFYGQAAALVLAKD
ncbi:MAG: beta-ketoacyl synthase N-terminal-like domain-containing protein [Planctomycetia bacterium]|nr:beta-ketoacyl synthase N-terminal-like domain-containing protein [Planctomycetia bacterium]